MGYVPGGTTARGLGWHHQQDKARLMRELKAAGGQGECPFPQYCAGQPMWHPDRCPYGTCWLCTLERDHTIPRALGGTNSPGRLAHGWCNRKAGARLRQDLAHAHTQPCEPHAGRRRW